MRTKQIIMNEQEIRLTLQRLSAEILEKNLDLANLCLVGIKSRGVPMAKYISDFIKKTENVTVETGILDISFYRDDLSTIDEKPIVNDNNLNFETDGKTIILIDDVLYTGKTVKTAMDIILSKGKPASIQLCVLIDRGHHQLPIYADFTGKFVPTSQEEIIKVNFVDTDNEENVKIVVK